MDKKYALLAVCIAVVLSFGGCRGNISQEEKSDIVPTSTTSEAERCSETISETLSVNTVETTKPSEIVSKLETTEATESDIDIQIPTTANTVELPDIPVDWDDEELEEETVPAQKETEVTIDSSQTNASEPTSTEDTIPTVPELEEAEPSTQPTVSEGSVEPSEVPTENNSSNETPDDEFDGDW